MVVQHLPLGGIIEWDEISTPSTITPIVSSNNNIHSATPAPWASVTGTTAIARSNDAVMTAGLRGYPSASLGEDSELASPRLDSFQNRP